MIARPTGEGPTRDVTAAADHHYAVAAPFYGFTPENKERIDGICPTLAQYGEHDKPFLKHAKRLSRHLDELGVEHEVIVHPDVGHSFMNDHDDASFRLGKYLPIRAAYDAETEAVAWEKLLACPHRTQSTSRTRPTATTEPPCCAGYV